ncbi:hypothetical protein HPP92_000951 [Vanilla planifolia]|uniref:NAC domain-containing protein n=1 Tax=Vanilla planifolia TaxID=51239 RepID=A0A835RXC4_VANPL|nr:hypothetical protein HPP92_000951 [Vanilla planifolia]
MIRETQVKLATLKESCDQGRVEMEDDELALPGFRFHPTDEELVSYYLRRKVNKKPISLEIIRDVDIYKHEPWDLPRMGTVGEKEMYFFCMRGRKYRNSTRPNRVTGSGFWKATGIDQPIRSRHGFGDCIGLKKSLVFYRGSAGKGTKTDWLMHEYRLPSTPSSFEEAEIWTLCRITRRNVSSNKYGKQLSSKEACNGGGRSPTGSSSEMGNLGHDGGEEKRLGGSNFFQQDEVFTEKYVKRIASHVKLAFWDVYPRVRRSFQRRKLG